MFTFTESPCIFEPIQLFNSAVTAPQFSSPVQKRRRICRAPSNSYHYKPQHKLQYDIDENDKECILTLYKPVSQAKLSDIVYTHLMDARDSYVPKCQLVSDFFGNQFYIQEDLSDEEILRKALNSLDMQKIGRQIAKENFQDYEITLNHEGDELDIASRNDDLIKKFDLGNVFEDVRVISCEMISENVSALRIGIEKPKQETIETEKKQHDPLNNLLEWCARNQQEESTTATEKTQTELKLQRQIEQRKAEEERQRQEEALKEQLLLKERNLQEQREREKRKALLAERKAQLVEKREREEREKREREEREKEKRIAERNAQLLEEQRVKKLREQLNKKLESSEKLVQKSSDTQNSSPQHVTININFNTPEKQTSSVSRQLPQPASPVLLEDIEDEEIHRYNESVSKSPVETSIIDSL